MQTGYRNSHLRVVAHLHFDSDNRAKELDFGRGLGGADFELLMGGQQHRVGSGDCPGRRLAGNQELPIRVQDIVGIGKCAGRNILIIIPG